MPFKRLAPCSLGVSAAIVCMGAFASSSAFAATVKPDAIVSSKSGGCGTIPYVAPNDPNHLLRTLPKSHSSAYEGFREFPIEKSAWANWKPKRKSGFNVQIVYAPLNNPIAAVSLKALQSTLRASGIVKTVQTQVPLGITDVAAQLGMLQTAISRKPDIILLSPLSAPAARPLVTKAGKQGIPVVTPVGGVSGKYGVNLNANLFLSNVATAADVLKIMGGKGNVLLVHGAKGIPFEQSIILGWNKALSRCPNVKVAGEVEGLFDPTTAKQVVQQWLATHPGGVDGAFEAAAMAQGVLGAFEQAGGKIPPLSITGASEGTLAYWYNHPKYRMAMGFPVTKELGAAPARVILRMLRGDGVKLNMLLTKPFVITTRSQVKGMWKPSYKEGGVNGVDRPAGTYFSNSYLDAFFTRRSK